MRGEIELRRDDFRDTPRTLYRTDGLTVTAFAYPSGVEALKLGLRDSNEQVRTTAVRSFPRPGAVRILREHFD